MIINPRMEPKVLSLLRVLNSRKSLEDKDFQYYLNLEKGYEGEQKFDAILEVLSHKTIILCDLLYEVNNTIFQIDTLLISQQTIYLFEVKNYEGDFNVKDDRWFTKTGTEIKNPLLQLKRSESLFRQFIQHLNFNYSIKAFLIFVNPEFTLYQASLNLPIIFPTQINRFIQKLAVNLPMLHQKHTESANQLLSMQTNDSPYTQIPIYIYEQLVKGITCATCHSFLTSNSRRLICNRCNTTEDMEHAGMRSIDEFSLLFPNRKITTHVIYDWCGGVLSKKTIRNILKKHYILASHGRSSYYFIHS